MPLPLPPNSIIEKNKLASTTKWVTLIQFEFDSGTLEFCLNNESVVWNYKTWVPGSMQLGEINETKEGELPTVTLQYFDITRKIIPVIDDNNGVLDGVVNFYFVHSSNLQLATTESDFAIDFAITNTMIDRNFIVTFTLSSENLTTLRFPPDTYTANFCRFNFKDVKCQYSGAETLCNGSLARCRELNNNSRFGGFPGIPQSAVYV